MYTVPKYIEIFEDDTSSTCSSDATGGSGEESEESYIHQIQKLHQNLNASYWYLILGLLFVTLAFWWLAAN